MKPQWTGIYIFYCTKNKFIFSIVTGPSVPSIHPPIWQRGAGNDRVGGGMHCGATYRFEATGEICQTIADQLEELVDEVPIGDEGGAHLTNIHVDNVNNNQDNNDQRCEIDDDDEDDGVVVDEEDDDDDDESKQMEERAEEILAFAGNPPGQKMLYTDHVIFFNIGLRYIIIT